MNWISVDECLPDPFVDVLCFCKDATGDSFKIGEKYCAIDRLCVWNDGHPTSFRTTRFDYGVVTHWMPLPEFPEVING